MENTILRYKYVPFSEGSLAIIKEGTMKFTSPSEFNDPFDCAPDINVGIYVDHVSNRKDLLKKAADYRGYSPAERIANKQKMLKQIENAVFDDFVKQLSKRIGVCSLSRDALNLLMWAHYAKNHTGFVVEFRIPTEQYCTNSEAIQYMLDYLFPLEVDYCEDKPILNSFEDKDKESNANKQFLVKGIDWAYEKEERVIDQYRGPGIHGYNRNAILKSVVAGMKMDPDDYSVLKQTIDSVNEGQGTTIELYQAVPVKGEYRLHVPGRDELLSVE